MNSCTYSVLTRQLLEAELQHSRQRERYNEDHRNRRRRSEL